MMSSERFFPIPKKTQLLPIKVSLFYLFGTFFLFLNSNLIDKVDNLFWLSLFVLFAYLSFYFGYSFGLSTKRGKNFRFYENSKQRIKNVNLIVLSGLIYFFIWGVNQIIDFGGASIYQVLTTIANPGSAYSAKFEVYEQRLATGAVNRVTQFLVILSIVYAIFIPVLLVYWKCIRPSLRIFSLFSIVVYVSSFLFIGTQKGLGDVVLFSAAGISVLIGSRSVVLDRFLKRKFIAYGIVLLVVVFTYMALNQSSRAEEFGLTSTLMTGDVSNTLLSGVFGERVALGIYTIMGYPSHGYLGLSYNLKTDFVFSYGAGFSQAFESYRYQFFGGINNFSLTYPARTEVLTGWPAGMYWSTAFPWFASDITFIGVVLLMFVVGFVFSRIWLSCIIRRDIVSIAILGQLFMFIAFLPANNQVLMQRQGLWIVVTVIFISVSRLILRRRA